MKSRGESATSFAVSMAVLVFFVFAFKQSVLDANNIPSGSMIPTLKIGDYLFVNKMRYSLRIPFTEVELIRIDDPARGDIITFIPPGDPGKNYVKRVMGMPGDRIRIRSVPACDLYKAYGETLPNVPREFSCDRKSPSYRYEPQLAFVEYKEGDSGEWKNYHPTELGSEEARKLLLDSDNVGVLPPELLPNFDWRGRMPVAFRENLPSGGTHLTIESSYTSPNDSLCEDIETTGCVIPPNQYLAMGDNRDDSRDSRYIGYIAREKILGKVVIIYFSINWKDDICKEFARDFLRSSVPPALDDGYKIPGFPPEKQRRRCSLLDEQADSESIIDYLRRTVVYRIPRMDVRWTRIANLLK
ncbi:MAG TPA: signal peptidase I [Leptospiraceae bacterium]|nr:signal peptidase I [Leptospiraceae bacterium]HMW58294.1 signal peptidase I [Leptospiraceae bacterium]HNK99843.1 signal peptidase I [Leptospiraceae bacterium]HNL68827.1 signal peptidase I [Leptospiraceae bacterium]HNN60712.1 signal peptidase I [Leptospiraceae bacterium]